ncbi:hypothetical protein ACO0QE_002942 [Hanseniaspora vineae]
MTHKRDTKQQEDLDTDLHSNDVFSSGAKSAKKNLSTSVSDKTKSRTSSNSSSSSFTSELFSETSELSQLTPTPSSSNIFHKFFEYLDPQAIDNFTFHSSPRELLRNKTGQLHAKTKNLLNNKAAVQQQLGKLDSKLQDVFFNEPTALEKLFYSFTLINLFAIGFIMGSLPEYFHVYYTFVFFVLMPIRFYTYYKTKNHYFMADLCYYVNFMVLAFIWAFPNSKELYISCFALSFGTLCWAVITWRNSLVVHSMDKVTSCFIHIMPPLTLYVIHYTLNETKFQEERFPIVALLRNNYNSGKNNQWSMKSSVFWTSLYYLVWQVLYHYFITFKKSEKVKNKERMTSFRYLTEHTFKNSPLFGRVIRLREPFPMVAYTLFQYLYQLLTMSLCSIWFSNRTAATLFLTGIFFSAAYRGATYYIDRYMDQSLRKEIKRLQFEIRSLQGEVKPEDLLLP